MRPTSNRHTSTLSKACSDWPTPRQAFVRFNSKPWKIPPPPQKDISIIGTCRYPKWSTILLSRNFEICENLSFLFILFCISDIALGRFSGYTKHQTPTTAGRAWRYGIFTLMETDWDTNSDLDSKPDGYIVLCRKFHIAQTRTRIPTLYFCTGQESESDSVPESVSGNVNEPLNACYLCFVVWKASPSVNTRIDGRSSTCRTPKKKRRDYCWWPTCMVRACSHWAKENTEMTSLSDGN